MSENTSDQQAAPHAPADSKEKKKLFIKTWGCQMNVYDSNRMADILAPFGYETVDTADDADMMILNTCHIREKATEKVFSEIGRMKEHKENQKKKGKQAIIAVAGCVAQAEGKEITDRAPAVDMVFGPQTYHELPEMIAKLTGAYGSNRIVNTDFPTESKFDFLPEENKNHGSSAFLSIQEGCDKFCTFCVVPYTRGAEYSRPVAQVLEEAKRMVQGGTVEIHLLGQNVNAFHGEGPDGKTWGLGRLIRAIAEIDGVQRIRYTTSHPRDVDEELIEAHRDIKQVMPYLHLPVQSGSDKILKAMNRKHTAEDYLRYIERFKEAQPDLTFSGDFIVGFPGETDEDHKATLRLVEQVGYVQAYSFKYSARPGTPAANMTNLVHERIKDERLQELQALLNKQQIAFNTSTIGRVLPVLFDRIGSREGQLLGKTPYMQSVYVEAHPRLLNQILDVKIERAYSNSVSGSLIMEERVSASNA